MTTTRTKLGDATIAQVVAAYELAQLNEYAIAEQLDIADPDEVTSILMQYSDVYKERNGNIISRGPNPLLSTDEVSNESAAFKELHKQYRLLAKTAESEIVREKALRWLMDNELGRNDVAKEMLALKKLELTKTNSQEERLAKFESLMRAGIRGQAPMQLMEKTA